MHKFDLTTFSVQTLILTKSVSGGPGVILCKQFSTRIAVVLFKNKFSAHDSKIINFDITEFIKTRKICANNSMAMLCVCSIEAFLGEWALRFFVRMVLPN